jgi:MYXO-CTERM domain-containing protein
MKISNTAAVLSLSIAAFAGGASAALNLVTNGDFSTGTFTGWTSWGDSTNKFVSSNIAAFGKNYTGSADASGGIYQDLATVAGQEYTVSFVVGVDYGVRDDFTAKFGSQLLLEIKDPNGLGYSMADHSFTAVAAGSTTRLEFGFMSQEGWYWFDNVSVTATPAPGAVALLGLAGLVTGRRRRA